MAAGCDKRGRTMLDARSRQMAALQACMPNAGADFTAPLLCHGCGRPGPRLTDPFSAALAPDSAGTTGGKAVAVMQTRPVSRRTCAQGISFTYAMEAGSSAIGVPAGGEEAAGQSAGKEGG